MEEELIIEPELSLEEQIFNEILAQEDCIEEKEYHNSDMFNMIKCIIYSSVSINKKNQTRIQI